MEATALVRVVIFSTAKVTEVRVKAALQGCVLPCPEAQVPLAHHMGRVACALQAICQSADVQRKAGPCTRLQEGVLQTRVESVPTSQKRCTSRSADGVAEMMAQVNALLNKSIQLWCLDLAAVPSDISVAQIIRQDDDNVRLPGLHCHGLQGRRGLGRHSLERCCAAVGHRHPRRPEAEGDRRRQSQEGCEGEHGEAAGRHCLEAEGVWQLRQRAPGLQLQAAA
mmetsp:Transcript_109138/g.304216  ORF Transcript_109138/g.304216 Transcript_109138/m.304216 type:complete len:224 (+) Transcript_109138:1676-2347(+)